MTATVATGKHSPRSAARDVGLGRSVSQTIGLRAQDKPRLLARHLLPGIGGTSVTRRSRPSTGAWAPTRHGPPQGSPKHRHSSRSVSYTHLRAHETRHDLV